MPQNNKWICYLNKQDNKKFINKIAKLLTINKIARNFDEKLISKESFLNISIDIPKK